MIGPLILPVSSWLPSELLGVFTDPCLISLGIYSPCLYIYILKNLPLFLNFTVTTWILKFTPSSSDRQIWLFSPGPWVFASVISSSVLKFTEPPVLCTLSSYLFVYWLIDVEVLGIELRALCTAGKHSLSDLHPQPCAGQVSILYPIYTLGHSVGSCIVFSFLLFLRQTCLFRSRAAVDSVPPECCELALFTVIRVSQGVGMLLYSLCHWSIIVSLAYASDCWINLNSVRVGSL